MERSLRNNRTLSALGLCSKAGKLVYGANMVCEALALKRKPFLVIEASDTSDNTSKRLTDKCNYYNVKKTKLNVSGEVIAHAIGKTGIIGAVAVTDAGLVSLIEKAIEDDSVDGLNK